MERAEESIIMLGWDFDSRVFLQPGGADATPAPGLAAFIARLLSRKKRLRVHILGWDYAMIYALERESLPLFAFGLRARQRLDFRLDNAHPFGGSHHQKIVVIDDSVAFAGGFDITRNRWDTPEHRGRDPRRVDPQGRNYPPFHDVQALVDGDTARALGDLVRQRWYAATGEGLSVPAPGRDAWPSQVRPDVRDVRVAISRTEPAYAGRPGVREVERLFIDSIAAARRSVYIESQYMTSTLIADALGRRLEERDGPEIVIVTPREPTGFLEESTMGVLRTHLLADLRKRDVFGRLRVYFPKVPGLPGKECLNVHSKVMVVDDVFVRVGSANLTNRSMGLDTECDVALEAERVDIGEAIAAFRNRLLAEHLGRREEEVARVVKEKGSLVAAIEAMAGGKRGLEPLDASPSPWLDGFVADGGLVDPAGPIEGGRVFRRMVSEEDDQVRHPFVKAGLLIFGLVLLAWLWHYGPFRDWFSVSNVERLVASFAGSPWAPLIVACAFTAAGVLMVPLTLMIMATALAFNPLPAFLFAMCGALCSATTGFWIGRLLGRDLVKRLAGERLIALGKRLTRRGILAVVLVRMIPLVPFTVANLVAGASGVRFRDYLAGTAVGLLPGIAMIALVAQGVEQAILRPSIVSVAVAVGIAAAALLAMRGLKRVLERAGTFPEERGTGLSGEPGTTNGPGPVKDHGSGGSGDSGEPGKTSSAAKEEEIGTEGRGEREFQG
jgi:phosphatidylserine/phosphatidylglycerophosphate/cardiolipin synthase-like enzyme/uncharacterized membrane protein YdjX (TVP38/TMEM64 family)